MKFSTETKVYAFFFAAFAGVVILGFVTYRSTRELIVNDRWVAHTHQVRQSIADLSRRRPGRRIQAARLSLFSGDSRYLDAIFGRSGPDSARHQENNRTHRRSPGPADSEFPSSMP